MPAGDKSSLTKRQAAVMERVDRRVPIKVIAQELGVSETRINQHIRALKDIYGAGSLGDLVDIYRAEKAEGQDSLSAQKDLQYEWLDSLDDPLRETAYRKSQVPSTIFGLDSESRDIAANVEFNDAAPLIESAPWLRPGEPEVVPGLLDGEHAVTFRLAAIVGITFGMLAAVILTATAAMMISEALSERAAVPVDEQGFS
jgi:DNA-binding CsgD family transcriptional regulator